MTFGEVIKALKDGKKIRRKSWADEDYWFIKNDKMVKKCKGVELSNIGYIFYVDLLTDDWEIYQEPILDEVERNYLGFVIRPFRDRVTYIRKHRYANVDYIYIGLGNNEVGMGFPEFTKDTMYKNMEVDRYYTLKELGL